MNNLVDDSREHINRCFFLNEPRSLHPHGYPIRTLSPSQQCDCYGYEPWPGTNVRIFQYIPFFQYDTNQHIFNVKYTVFMVE